VSKPKKLKVALIHDYLAEYGGAERVLEVLHDIFPEAPLFTAFVDKDRLGVQWQRFADWQIQESWLTKIPGYKKLFSPLRIWAPSYFSQFDLTGFDLIISSTNAYFAKAIKVPKGSKHICYCHTPSRSLWGYSTMTDWKKNPIIRWGGELINHYLRIKDLEIARKNVDLFIANSKETQRRIKKFYRLKSEVVYPPVKVAERLPVVKGEIVDQVYTLVSGNSGILNQVLDDKRSGDSKILDPHLRQDRQVSHDDQEGYYLYVNRLAWSKHPEMAVEVCTTLNLPLKVVGSGKMLDQLKAMAGPTIEFCGFVPDRKLADLYLGATALLYPVADEDFGMIPVEAMGYGLPVIAHRSGGPLESIIDGKTGVFFDDLSVAGLSKAIEQHQKLKLDKKAIHKQARQFSEERFKDQISGLINKLLTA